MQKLLQITDKIKKYLKIHKSSLLKNKREDEKKIEEIRKSHKPSGNSMSMGSRR